MDILTTDTYVPGVCNIGPVEIARRHRAGQAGAAVTVGLAALLTITRAPRAWRLLLAIPATVSAVGFIQAARHFCAAFGWRGIFNFGGPGSAESVEEAAARAEDRRLALRIALESSAVGAAVALLSLCRAGRRPCC
jgi:hypothetical protein